MTSEMPQGAVSELSHESYLIKQEIRLAQFSTSPGDIATARQESSAALLESIHKSRDQYQSFYNVQHLILPAHPTDKSRWSLLKTKMDILQTLKSSLEQACDASNDLQQSTKQFLRNVTMRDVDARISKDSRDLEAARVVDEKWERSKLNEHNRYLQLCEDIPQTIFTSNGFPRATWTLLVLYLIAVAIITYRYQSPGPQTEAVEVDLKHDFEVSMLDMYFAFSGAMLAVCIATTKQLNELSRRRRSLDFFYPPKLDQVANGGMLFCSLAGLTLCVVANVPRFNK